MKVIQEGNWNLPWSAEVTCKTCTAVLSIDENDLKAHDNEGQYVSCPICKRSIHIADETLTQRLIDELKKKRKYYSTGDQI